MPPEVVGAELRVFTLVERLLTWVAERLLSEVEERLLIEADTPLTEAERLLTDEELVPPTATRVLLELEMEVLEKVVLENEVLEDELEKVTVGSVLLLTPRGSGM